MEMEELESIKMIYQPRLDREARKRASTLLLVRPSVTFLPLSLVPVPLAGGHAITEEEEEEEEEAFCRLYHADMQASMPCAEQESSTKWSARFFKGRVKKHPNACNKL